MEKYKILIVEDDDFFRETIVDLLSEQYHVLEAPNGKRGREIILIESPDLVISDIQMPGFSGLDLLEWSKNNKPVPFIIMTGFSLALETKSAFDLGARGFVAKPFKKVELLGAIHAVLPPKEEVEEDKIKGGKDQPELCKVPIEEFVTLPRIKFDVYIKLSDDKIVKIAHKGDAVPAEKVNSYKEKGLKYLYIPKEDFDGLVDFNINLTRIIKDRQDILPEKKANFLKYTIELIMEKVYILGLDKKLFEDAHQFLEMTVEMLTRDDTRFDLLNVMSSTSDVLYAHALGVSLYSIMIGKKLGIESSVTLSKLGEAGLYHDVGQKEIDRSLLEKPRYLQTSEERRILEGHVIRGREILLTLKGISEDVVRMVTEHHEDLRGTGYPFRKKKNELHPLSKILQVANLFVNEIFEELKKNKNISGLAVIGRLEATYGDRIDSQCIGVLRSFFHNS